MSAAASSSSHPQHEPDPTVLEPFAHEPNAVRAPDGSWVIYMTLRHPPGKLFNCSSNNFAY